MKKILIVEDHILVRISLRIILEELFGELLLTEADNFPDARELAGQERFDLVVLDVGVPGSLGTQMVAIFRQKLPDAAILICSAIDEDKSALLYLQAGADGFLPKTADSEEIANAFKTVMNGQKYVSPSISQQLLHNLSEQKSSFSAASFSAASFPASLSHREAEVMRLLLEGKWIKEIAAELNLHTNTISTYKARIFEKAGVSSTVELVKKLNGLLPG